MGLEVFDGDDGMDDDLFRRLRSEGEEVADASDDQGYGHHDGAVLVLYQGQYYVVSGSGCSCGGSADIDGPFRDQESALRSSGDNEGDLRRALGQEG
jgi:hypothetical protein